MALKLHSQGSCSAEHIYAIGRIILAWSVFEDTLRRGISTIAGMSEDDGTIILHEMSFPGLLDRLRHLLADRKGLEIKKDLERLLGSDGDKRQSLLQIYAWRNLCAHNIFGAGSKPGTVTPLALKLRGEIRVHAGELTAEHLYSVSEMILERTREVMAFLAKHGFFGPTTTRQP
jgi:hypothetical protein